MDQNLDDAAHEAGVAEVDQSSQPCGGVLTEPESAKNQWSVDTISNYTVEGFNLRYCIALIALVLCVFCVHQYSFMRTLFSDWLL